MTNKELDAWERKENVLEVLTSLEFGAWLNRRDKNKETLERKRGKWIDQVVEDELLAQKCSVCGYLEYVYGRPNYCPNCGARMDERREDAEAVNTKN